MGVMSVPGAALWLEKGWWDTWKQVWEILATDVVFRLLDITVEHPSCILPTLILVT